MSSPAWGDKASERGVNASNVRVLCQECRTERGRGEGAARRARPAFVRGGSKRKTAPFQCLPKEIQGGPVIPLVGYEILQDPPSWSKARQRW